MPRPTRRSQVATAQPISSFTRVSKTQAFYDASLKKAVLPVEPSASPSRKRKAAAFDGDVHPRVTRRTASFAPSSDEEDLPIKRACRRQEPQPTAVTKNNIVTKGKRTARATPSRTETAHRPAEKTVIAHSRRQARTVQAKIETSFKKLSKAKEEGAKSNTLPAHLLELVALHKSFLKTVVIHIAHNGSNTPIDFRSISPNISASWGKRAVSIEDIRRCIALESSAKHQTVSPFIVSDYGRGKVCIELGPGCDQAAISEQKLCRQFEENLQALCAEKATDEMTDVDIPLESLSLGDLPKVDITNRSLIQANPVLSKGQRALEEFKSGIASKQEDKAKQSAAAAANATLNPDGTKMGLLDRLRLKQLAKASGPVPPSGPELQRRAALNRVGDVAATISMLSLSNPMSLPRQAFTMAVILEKLKDSLRTPLSREEGATCVRLIASEVAPEWLRVVTIGGRENVVVQRTAQPVNRVMQERVQKLMG